MQKFWSFKDATVAAETRWNYIVLEKKANLLIKSYREFF